MADAGEQKRDWPELVGKTGEEAKAVVSKDRPDVNVMVMDFNAPCTRDLREDRVRIMVDKDNVVCAKPYVG